jgi:uncharacterized protein involved in exopolysaccharide biosynthesis
MNSGHEQLGAGDVLSIDALSQPLRRSWRTLVVVPLACGGAALALTYVVPPTFTAQTTFIVPQQQGSTAAAALATLGSLGGLPGAVGGASSRTTADQFAALLRSVTIADRLIDHFDLMAVHQDEFRVDVRRRLAENTRITVGRKDGMIVVEADDRDPKRASAIANQYVEELRVLTGRLALSEAQQRRVFFEGLMVKARDDLIKAQVALQSTGFTSGTIRAEPRVAADAYSRVRAEVNAAELRLRTMRQSLADGTPEILRAESNLQGLRAQLARLERDDSAGAQPDYLVRYREFKYQETLFDLFARQYEAARVDEAREGALIQVVDVAQPPERRSRPKRSLVGTVTTVVAFIVVAFSLIVVDAWRNARRASAV